MSATSNPHRGEVWWVDLEPRRGSEQGRRRPCLIISNDHINRHRRTVIVIPLTSGRPFPRPMNVPVRFREVEGSAVPDQIRAIDRSRLGNLLGVLLPQELDDIEESLGWAIGFSARPESEPGVRKR